jgi:hypothetical protein
VTNFVNWPNVMTTGEIAEAECMAHQWEPYNGSPAQGGGDLLE